MKMCHDHTKRALEEVGLYVEGWMGEVNMPELALAITSWEKRSSRTQPYPSNRLTPENAEALEAIIKAVGRPHAEDAVALYYHGLVVGRRLDYSVIEGAVTDYRGLCRVGACGLIL